MPYNNTYAAPASLTRAPVLNPGGVCSILFFLHEDVAKWPVINPATGIISDSVVMKVGKTSYSLVAAEVERFFREELKRGPAGSYHDVQVNAKLPGNTNNITHALGRYQHHQFGLLIKDRNGEQRLIGDRDSGAQLFFDYQSGDFNDPRTRQLRWTWASSQPCPIYHSGGLSVVVPPICAGYYLVDRFRVGAPGAPMVEGDNTYTNASLANTNYILFADGIAIHQVVDSESTDQRYSTKPYGDTSIYINGGVTNGEVIEIYKVF